MCREVLLNILNNPRYIVGELKLICESIWENCASHYPDDLGLASYSVTTFLFLRVVCQAITFPENFGLIDINSKVNGKIRRRLYLVSKVIENTACQATVSNDPGLTKTIPFGKDYFQQLRDFARTISQRDASLIQIIQPSLIDLSNVDIKELFKLHELIYMAYENLNSAPAIKESPEGKNFTALFEALGKPIFMVSRKPKSIQFLPVTLEILKYFESNGIMYRGDTLPTGEAVLYFGVHQLASYIKKISEMNRSLTLQFIDNLTLFMTGVGDVKNYVVVIDFSYYSADELKEQDYIELCVSLKQLNPTIQNNFKKAYFVQPGKSMKKVLDNICENPMIYGFPVGWEKSVEVVEDWQTLIKKFEPSKCMISNKSKTFIKNELHASKINDKGKVQDRIITTTMEKMLNVDPISKTILNEIELKNIEEVKTYEKVAYVGFRFTGGKKENEERRYFFPYTEMR